MGQGEAWRAVKSFFKRLAYVEKRLKVLGFGVLACCGGNPDDYSTELGKRQLVARAQIIVGEGLCEQAIDLVRPVYESENTDDRVRKAMASAYACRAGVGFFSRLNELTSYDLTGGFFWQSVTEMFYSPSLTRLDEQIASSLLAADALKALRIPGSTILSSFTIFENSFNPGSLLGSQRTPDANLLLFLMSVATIGSTQARYGNPDPTTFLKGNPLPWETSTQVIASEIACGYAGSIVTLFQSLDAVLGQLSGTLADVLDQVPVTLASAVDLACEAGCTGGVSGCALGDPSICNPCPVRLEHRESCVIPLVADDQNPVACAAAGILDLVNNTALGWQGP